jgi:hypothetical protein
MCTSSGEACCRYTTTTGSTSYTSAVISKTTAFHWSEVVPSCVVHIVSPLKRFYRKHPKVRGTSQSNQPVAILFVGRASKLAPCHSLHRQARYNTELRLHIGCNSRISHQRTVKPRHNGSHTEEHTRAGESKGAQPCAPE